MKRRLSVFAVSLFVFLVWANPGLACTSFVLQDEDKVVFGKSYDWNQGLALVFVNKRGVSKTAWTGARFKGRPVKWVSKYGSLTFNQYGREFPTGGINEAGLVIEVSLLASASYPPVDARPYVGSVLQWEQYVLDTCNTIEQVVAANSKIRIPPVGQVGIHFLAGDKSGSCASVEFIDGRTVVHTGPTMPVKTLTNSTYASSIKEWTSGAEPNNIYDDSIRRFIDAADMVRRFGWVKDKPAIGYAFSVLDRVKRGQTQWQIVYDITQGMAHFKTKINGKLRSIDTRNFDYSCASPVLMLDIDVNPAGDVTGMFAPYTRAANRELVGRSRSRTSFLQDTPKAEMDRIADYPETSACDQ